MFLHSHAGKKSELVERAVFTLVAPSLWTVGSPPPVGFAEGKRLQQPSIHTGPPSGDVNGVVGNGDCRFPWTNV